jgi:hypothetical protein
MTHRIGLFRLILAVGAGVVTVVALGVPVASHADDRRAHCGPAGAKTIIANERIRIYKEPADEDDVSNVAACLAGTNVVRQLEGPRDTYYVFRPPALQLRGTAIGSATDYCGDEAGCQTIISVQDLARPSPEQFLNEHRGGLGGQRRVKVGSLRFRPSGSLAWIACIEPDPEVFSASRAPNCVRPGRGRKWVMRKLVGADTAEVLDSGRQIDPSSLRLSGTHLTWRHGRRRASRLP